MNDLRNPASHPDFSFTTSTSDPVLCTFSFGPEFYISEYKGPPPAHTIWRLHIIIFGLVSQATLCEKYNFETLEVPPWAAFSISEGSGILENYAVLIGNRYLAKFSSIATTSSQNMNFYWQLCEKLKSIISSFVAYPSWIQMYSSTFSKFHFLCLQVLAPSWTDVLSSRNIWCLGDFDWNARHVMFRLLAILACRRSCRTGTALLARWTLPMNFIFQFPCITSL